MLIGPQGGPPTDREVRRPDVMAAFEGHDHGAQAARMVIMSGCVIDRLEGADDR
jgi:hypothetical protein